jgi:hypothetical protein
MMEDGVYMINATGYYRQLGHHHHHYIDHHQCGHHRDHSSVFCIRLIIIISHVCIRPIIIWIYLMRINWIFRKTLFLQKRTFKMKSYYLFHAIFNFCVIFLILQHMKQNHNHITSYQSGNNIIKFQISYK